MMCDGLEILLDKECSDVQYEMVKTHHRKNINELNIEQLDEV